MADPTPHSVDIQGRLRVETGGEGFDVVAEGNRVVIDIPSMELLRSMLGAGGVGGGGDENPGSGGFSKSQQRAQLNQLTALLDRYDLDVVIRLKGQTIATLGRSAKPGTFEKMFSLQGIDLNFKQFAKALFRRS